MANLSHHALDNPEAAENLTASTFSIPDATQAQTPSNSTSGITPQPTLTPQPFPPGKVAIPRGRPAVVHGKGRRVPRACETCRMRKTKCSGDRPVCRQCRELQSTCSYPASAREKSLRDLSNSQKKLEISLSLLHEAKSFVPGRTATKIEEFLHSSNPSYVSNNTATGSVSRLGIGGQELAEPSSSSTSIGSLDSLDHVNCDINDNDISRATGNIGKSSEITWMQSLEGEAVQQSNTRAANFGFDDDGSDNKTKPLPNPHDLNYHLDDFDIGISEPVQMYWVPPRHLADTLYNTYLRVTHPYLPIISRPLFSNQYKNFFDNSAIPGDKWLGILNMVFAIAASYAQKMGLEQHGDPQDHLVYLTRARILSMNGDDVLRHPDLQQVQVEGLISFYLLSTHQIHRSWRMSALAIRSAVSLGLNLKSKSQSVTSASKEARSRLWWSLYIVENRLGLMTGRPTCIPVNMCSSPFPLPLSDEQLNTSMGSMLLHDPGFRDKHINDIMVSSHTRKASSRSLDDDQNIAEAQKWLSSLPASAELVFLYSCDLTILSQEVLNDIYTVDSMHRSRRHLQARVEEIKLKVDLWLTSLPRSLDFTNIQIQDNDEARDKRMQLACQYYSTRIVLGRPFLCTSEKSGGYSEDEQRFAHAMAVDTVRSASQIAQLVPDSSSDNQTLAISPWWCCLHYVMQTVTVLIIELSLDCIHMAEQKNSLLLLAKKCIRWLDRTSKYSLAAHRAWYYCNSSLRRIALSKSLAVDDLPSMSSWQTQAGSTQSPTLHGQTRSGPSGFNLTEDYNLQGRDDFFPMDPLMENSFDYLLTRDGNHD